MYRRLLSLFAAIMLLLIGTLPANASAYGTMELRAPTVGDTYQVCSTYITPAASPTDVFIINGSSTKTVEVLRLEVSPYVDNGGGSTGSYAVYAVKRSTANTGGTSASITPTKCDSNSGAATCSAKQYSANPSALGTSAGTIGQVAINASYTISIQPYVLYDHRITGKPVLLNGTAEGLAVNLNAASIYTNGKLLITAYIKER